MKSRVRFKSGESCEQNVVLKEKFQGIFQIRKNRNREESRESSWPVLEGEPRAKDSTGTKTLDLHVTKPISIPGITYGPLGIAKGNLEHKSWSSPCKWPGEFHK